MPYPMKQERLASLADAIFAIVMTILVLSLKVPEFQVSLTNGQLWSLLQALKLPLLSFVFSFALLFIYWRSHHFITSVYAKNIDLHLTTINAIFFLFVALIPFTTHLLGVYSANQLAISIYAVNIILIGLVLFWMKRYVIVSHDIKSILTQRDIRNGNIRILLPVFFAAVAIPLGFVDTTISLSLFTFAILFNFIPRSTDIIAWILDLGRPRSDIDSAGDPPE